MSKGPHHTGTYHRRALKLRAQANANPNTLCWRCGQPARNGDPWTAGHLRDGDPTSPLLPEHASCNYRAGAIMRNERHANPKPSRRW